MESQCSRGTASTVASNLPLHTCDTLASIQSQMAYFYTLARHLASIQSQMAYFYTPARHLASIQSQIAYLYTLPRHSAPRDLALIQSQMVYFYTLARHLSSIQSRWSSDAVLMQHCDSIVTASWPYCSWCKTYLTGAFVSMQTRDYIDAEAR
jgi:hypothetical protein